LFAAKDLRKKDFSGLVWNYILKIPKISLESVDKYCIMKAQDNDNAKEKKMISNKFNIGDKVVFEFVVDVPENVGVVVGVNDDKVEVEYEGYVMGGGHKVYREWLNVEEIDFLSNWVF
jgi:hypothetical protein